MLNWKLALPSVGVEGIWSSVTTTFCAAVDVLPDASVMVHVTTVVPTEKDEGASLVTTAPLQLSDVVGVHKDKKLAVTAHVPPYELVFAFTVAGAVMVGFVLSAMTIVPEPSATLPAASVPCKYSVCGPSSEQSKST